MPEPAAPESAVPERRPDEAVLLAFDFGLKKIGVAVGNTLTRQARPLAILRAETRAQRFEGVSRLLAEWQPHRVVVGLPLTLDGGEQDASRQARRFANQLAGRYGLEVLLVDERGSSLEAQALRGRHGDEDDVAAAVILQRHFDGQGPGAATERII